MSSGRYPRGLPPQYPHPRRGSNSPISVVAATAIKPSASNRSRSLDDLLDSESSEKAASANAAVGTEINPSSTTKSCDDLDKNFDDCDILIVKPDNSSTVSDDKVSIQSGSSETKRKRNFMDRCVNKVRSLIKK